MGSSNLFGFLYVSTFVLIWGTLGSIIDYPLLSNSIYTAGSLGQLTTFSLTGFISTVIGVMLFGKVVKVEYLQKVFNLK